MQRKVRWSGRIVVCVLMVLSATLLSAEDWSGTDCGISFSYDGSIWKVMPDNPNYDMGLLAQGSFDNDPAKPFYQIMVFRCRQAPGSELSQKMRDGMRNTFQEEGGNILKAAKMDFSGAPAFYVYGWMHAEGQFYFETRWLVRLKDRFMLLTMQTPTDKVLKANISHPSFQDILASFRFKGFAPEPQAKASPKPPPRKTVKSADWGLKGLVGLAPQAGWDLLEQTGGKVIMTTKDGQASILMEYEAWNPRWDPSVRNKDDKNFRVAWFAQLMSGAYGEWEKEGTLTVDGAPLKWKGGWEYSSKGYAPEDGHNRRKTYFKRTKDGVVWIRCLEMGGWKDPFTGESVVKALKWKN